MPVQTRYHEFLNDQRQFFDELITEDWETYHSEDWDYVRNFEVDQLFKRVQPNTILDVGCGVGFHDLFMAQYPFVESVDAIDYSPQSISKANAVYPHPKVHRICADYTTYESDHQYDLVVSYQVFEHLNNPEEYLRFCSKTCKTGGVVAICTPNRLRIDNFLNEFIGNQTTMIDIMHYREYSKKELYTFGRCFGLNPTGWFGHSIHPITLGKFTLFNYTDVKKRVMTGYRLPWVSSVICVLMKKI